MEVIQEMRRENNNEKVNYNKVQANQKKEESVKPVQENFETETKEEKVEEVVEEKKEEAPAPKVEEKKEEVVSDKYATVIGCEELNIRSSADDSTASNVVTVAKKGTKFKTTGKTENNFVEIEWNGQKVFGMAQYLSIE